MVTPDTADTAEPEVPANAEKQKLNLQVKVDTTNTCKRHVTVTIPREDIDRYFQEAFDEFTPKAEVPGFRPGRAPRKLVEKNFREQMSNQVKGSLLMDSVSQVADSAEFSAISEPDFDFEAVEMPSDGPLTFEFDIEVRPEFTLPEWKGLKLVRHVHEYTDGEVDKHLRKLLTRYGKTVSREDAVVGPEDQVVINITFRDGDQVLSQVSGKNVTVKPILSFSDGNIEGFDRLILGKKAGDRVEAKVTISKEAENETLRGKEISATIEIAEVNHVELPELTPAFLDRIGGFVDESELKDAVREELERQLAYNQQRRIRQQITSHLIKDAKWDLPEDMLRRQFRREFDRAVLELRSAGFDDDQIRAYQNQIKQNSMNSTAASLKEHFIFERLAEEQKIEAEERDYDTEIRAIAAQAQESARRVRARLEKRGQMDALRNQIIEHKVIDLITSHAEFSDVPFEPAKDDTAAIDHAISGHVEEAHIPEAKYGSEAEELPGSQANKK
jgi:trigger factor